MIIRWSHSYNMRVIHLTISVIINIFFHYFKFGNPWEAGYFPVVLYLPLAPGPDSSISVCYWLFSTDLLVHRYTGQPVYWLSYSVTSALHVRDSFAYVQCWTYDFHMFIHKFWVTCLIHVYIMATISLWMIVRHELTIQAQEFTKKQWLSTPHTLIIFKYNVKQNDIVLYWYMAAKMPNSHSHLSVAKHCFGRLPNVATKV